MAAAGEIVRVALHYEMPNAGDVMNVFHFTLGGSVGTDAAVLDGIQEWLVFQWGANWNDVASPSCELVSFEADVMNTDGTVARNLGGDLLNIVGTYGGETQAAAVSGYLLAYTTIPKARGSKYVPGMAEEDAVNGGWNAHALGQLAILLGVYLTEYITTGGLALTPGLLSRTLQVFVPFLVSGGIDSLPAYQRRRKAGVGI